MSIKRMFKEEWRMHSRIYSGRSFAFFPALVFLLTAGFSLIVQKYSTLTTSAIVDFLPVFGLFLGLGVGAVGFSSNDAFKNILGRTNFLVYSSRTLPVSKIRLLTEFIVKDLVYYSLFFIMPVMAGIMLVGGFSASILNIFPAFIGAIIFSLVLTRSSLKLPSIVKPSYREGSPLVQKSLLDLERSSGGLMKIIFSLTLLSGFYWFLVLNFPFANVFLQQPMVSFAALLGTISITVYNWLNRFDSAEDYAHLPVDKSMILKAKQKAFVKITFPLLAVLTVSPIYFYSGNLGLATITAFSTATYALGAVSKVFELDPNTRIYSSKHFSKLIALNSLVIVPIMLAAVFNLQWYVILAVDGLAAFSGLFMSRTAVKNI